jgi:hypothetical protein
MMVMSETFIVKGFLYLVDPMDLSLLGTEKKIVLKLKKIYGHKICFKCVG